MNTLILMAGRGTRFKELSPDLPKPLVPLHGQPLVRWVVENLRLETKQMFIFACLAEHVEKYQLHKLFGSWGIDFRIISVNQVTEGAACTALLCQEHIDSSAPLLIANSDQYVVYDKQAFVKSLEGLDGTIMTMRASGPKWSYVSLGPQGYVHMVKEKVQISETATVGIYYFAQGTAFVRAAKAMISANDRYNNEFYLAPSYNYLIQEKKKIGTYNVGELSEQMIGLGTSEDFGQFERNPLSTELAREIFA